MNTKTDVISSGLLASIYLAFSDDGENIRFWTSNAFHAVEWAQENWETEAFVRLSDAEAIISQQAARIKELEAQFQQTHEWLCDRNQQIHEQSAALKLAREALFDMQDSYAAVHWWKDSFVIAATTAIAAIDSLQKGE